MPSSMYLRSASAGPFKLDHRGATLLFMCRSSGVEGPEGPVRTHHRDSQN